MGEQSKLNVQKVQQQQTIRVHNAIHKGGLGKDAMIIPIPQYSPMALLRD